MKHTKSPFQTVMERTALITGAATAFLLLLQLLFLPQLLPLTITAGVTCYHFSMRLLVGYAVSTAGSRIRPDARWFTPRAWEAPLYRFLRVRHWKRHVPTYDPASFDLRLHTPPQILHTMCVSEIVHETILVLSFLPMLLILPFGSPAVFGLTSLAAAAVDCVFVILQRYNRPRITKLTKRGIAHNL